MAKKISAVDAGGSTVHSQGDLFNIIRAFSGQSNMLVIPRELIRFTGDVYSALLLSQLLYWNDRTDDSEGWIYKTYSEWEEELSFNEYHTRTAAKRLEKMGIVERKVKKAPDGSPTVHYRVVREVFTDSFLQFLQNRNCKISRNESAKFAVSSITETTTETTNNVTQESSDTLSGSNDDSVQSEVEAVAVVVSSLLPIKPKKKDIRSWLSQYNKDHVLERVRYVAKRHSKRPYDNVYGTLCSSMSWEIQSSALALVTPPAVSKPNPLEEEMKRAREQHLAQHA